jgi:hypothetical protein
VARVLYCISTVLLEGGGPDPLPWGGENGAKVGTPWEDKDGGMEGAEERVGGEPEDF